MNAPDEFLRDAIAHAHAAAEACFYTVPDLQPAFFRCPDFKLDNIGHVSTQSGRPYEIPDGVVLVAQFRTPTIAGGAVGCHETVGRAPWPRVVWVSSAPAGAAVLPLVAGWNPVIALSNLVPDAPFWLNCYTPYRTDLVHYYGRRR